LRTLRVPATNLNGSVPHFLSVINTSVLNESLFALRGSDKTTTVSYLRHIAVIVDRQTRVWKRRRRTAGRHRATDNVSTTRGWRIQFHRRSVAVRRAILLTAQTPA